MFLSVFDVFKIGIGPSSSHTMGPMNAAAGFVEDLADQERADQERAKAEHRAPDSGAVAAIKVTLHGSLAFTGKGHATDRAVLLGLLGFRPHSLDPSAAERLEAEVYQSKRFTPPGLPAIHFDPAQDIVFDYGPPLPGHSNGLVLTATDADGRTCLTRTCYSIGGGFVKTEAELTALTDDDAASLQDQQEELGYPWPFGTAAQMLAMGEAANMTIAQMKAENEIAYLARQSRGSSLDLVDILNARLGKILTAMNDCMDRGLEQEGVLPGGIGVQRRAHDIHQQLLAESGQNMSQPHIVNDWLSVYAMAVNEENAAGGRVVTSPTNGAAGVVPAVIRYYRNHCIGATDDGVRTFILVAAAIGGLIKHNASISGAEVGCQGEVGSAAAMAAAGFCAALGGSNAQIENAAEIALEHHLGMTCDPAGGLVQVPCIERNALGAIKAVSAASLALRGNGTHFMPLDNCIETMRQTGVDMNDKYKETSQGGLAVNLPGC